MLAGTTAERWGNVWCRFSERRCRCDSPTKQASPGHVGCNTHNRNRYNLGDDQVSSGWSLQEIGICVKPFKSFSVEPSLCTIIDHKIVIRVGVLVKRNMYTMLLGNFSQRFGVSRF